MAKCFLCNKKLSLVEETSGLCKCGHTYCARHRCIQQKNDDDESIPKKNCHPCSWDWLEKQKTIIARQNPHVKSSKLEII